MEPAEFNTLAAFTLATALAAGVLGQTLARHLRIPGITVLLVLGVVLGPDVTGLIHPENLGPMLQMLIGMAVAVILFEGGLHLDLKHLRREAVVIRRLITSGALITALGAALSAKYMMNWDWRTAMLFGALVIVTGPTVVTPLLRRIGINRNLQTILEAEGVLIDPVGAIIAVMALEIAVSMTANSFAVGLLGIFLKYGLGMLVGLLGGLAIGYLLKLEKVVPDEFENILTLTLVLFLFELSNRILPESGIMTVTIAGMVVGNMKIPDERRLYDFKEQLTLMLIGLLFILLPADVRLADVQALGLPGLLTVGLVMFVVRPLNVAFCARGSQLTGRERLFMSWLAPRGIVAAAVASLFAYHLKRHGFESGESLRALVFLVIAVTVVLQGFTAGPLAKLLGVKRKRNFGYTIIGANPLGRLLSKLLQASGEEVVLIDRNHDDCLLAEAEGSKIIFGNALEELSLFRAGIDSRRAVLALTPNEGINLMLVRKVKQLTKHPDLHLSLRRGTDVDEATLKHYGAKVLFGTTVDIDLWFHRLSKTNTQMQKWNYQGDKVYYFNASLKGAAGSVPEAAMLPLVVSRNKDITPLTNAFAVRKNDIVQALVFTPEAELVREWYIGQGFVEDDSSTAPPLDNA